VQDPAELRQPGIGLNRDPVRTPMPWNSTPNAGFTAGEPWLPLNADWKTRNVEAQIDDPASMLTLYRRLLGLRRAHPALSLGDWRLLPSDGDVLAYERAHGADRLLIALNLGAGPQRAALPGWAVGGTVLLSTLDSAAMLHGDTLTLHPNEGLIIAPKGG
jgi:alpha-glucosidase